MCGFFFLFDVFCLLAILMRKVIVGHSWVRRLEELYLLPHAEFSCLGYGGATFSSLASRLEHLKPNPAVEVVFVFAGSNDLDNVSTTAEVNSVFLEVGKLEGVLQTVFPNAKIVFGQVEDRYQFDHKENPSALLDLFKRKSNKYNKWLNKWVKKNHLFVLKGANGFSDPSLYARDGVHLNFDGNVKLAQKLKNFVI